MIVVLISNPAISLIKKARETVNVETKINLGEHAQFTEPFANRHVIMRFKH